MKASQDSSRKGRTVVVENDMGKDRAEEKCELERETGFEPATLALASKIPEGLLTSEYIGQQFVERLVHYVLSVPAGSYTMAQLSRLLEELDPRAQVFFFKRLKENSPDSLKDFAPLYYGFMNEFHSLLFT
jgi:hypothetical protein